VPLRGLAALLLLGGIVYALLSGNWGIGAMVFGLEHHGGSFPPFILGSIARKPSQTTTEGI
jgi:hypothetical protein